jgi:hypothetical protein
VFTFTLLKEAAVKPFSILCVLLCGLVLTLSCGEKEQVKVTAPATPKPPEPAASAPAPASKHEQPATPESEKAQPAGKEGEIQQAKDEQAAQQPPAGGEKMPWQLESANDPYGILIDPNDKTKNMSYWRDAQVGDWVRFINHVGAIVVFTVVERDGSNLKFEAKLFSGDGKEVSMDKKGTVIAKPPDAPPDIRLVDIEKDDAEARLLLKTNPFIKVRNVVDWKVLMSDKVIHCEHRFTEKPDWTNETLYSRDVRAGGCVFARSNNDTYVLLLDRGDKNNLPKWDIWTADDLKEWRFRWSRFLHQEFVENEDPQEPEPPERAEDPPSQAIVSQMTKVAAIFAQKIATPIEKGGDLTETAKELENLLPLLKELENLHKKERFGYGASEAQALTNAALNLKEALSRGDAKSIKESLSLARYAYERLRIATDSEVKW